MTKKAKSILDEMERILPEQTKHQMVSVRGDNIIKSTINLFEDMRKNFTEEEFEELKSKFINAIRSEDKSKFTNKVRRLESK